MLIEVHASRTGFEVVEVVEVSGRKCLGYLDRSKSRAGANRIAAELRRGVRRYDRDKGHTVPVKVAADPIAALLGGAS